MEESIQIVSNCKKQLSNIIWIEKIIVLRNKFATSIAELFRKLYLVNWSSFFNDLFQIIKPIINKAENDIQGIDAISMNVLDLFMRIVKTKAYCLYMGNFMFIYWFSDALDFTLNCTNGFYEKRVG